MTWLNDLSNTNAKLLIVALVVLATALRVLFLPMPATQPGWLTEWLLFVSGLWGGSVYQYRVRTRERTKVATAQAAAAVTNDAAPLDPRPGMTPTPDEAPLLAGLAREFAGHPPRDVGVREQPGAPNRSADVESLVQRATLTADD